MNYEAIDVSWGVSPKLQAQAQGPVRGYRYDLPPGYLAQYQAEGLIKALLKTCGLQGANFQCFDQPEQPGDGGAAGLTVKVTCAAHQARFLPGFLRQLRLAQTKYSDAY